MGELIDNETIITINKDDIYIKIEDEMNSLIVDLMSRYRVGKSKKGRNKGFYYHFLRLREALHYSVSGSNIDNDIETLFQDEKKFNNVLRAWSNKLHSYMEGSRVIVNDYKNKKLDENFRVKNVTIGNQLPLVDFLILLNMSEWSDERILRFVKLFRD